MTPAESLSRAQILWCVGSLSAALLPHTTRLSSAITACFALLAGWRILAAWRVLPMPDRRHRALWWLKQLLALSAFVAIFVAYRGQIGRDAGVALLAALLGLKLLEVETTRDFYIATLLAYFLVVTNFFYSQTVPTAVYMFLVVVFITSTLVRFNVSPRYFSGTQCLKLGMQMVAQAMPIMLVAFLLYPRLPGPLFGLPQDAFDAVTGLSDSMSLGEITRLGLSDEVAFRVDFEGKVPRASELYWRGPVLWRTDGRSWRTLDQEDAASDAVRALAEPYHYTVMLEASDQPWLIGLDAVLETGRAGRRTADLALRAPEPVRKRIRYTLSSATRYRADRITPAERAAALQLPGDAHPRTRALAREWRAVNRSSRALIEEALALFRADFGYTLEPPALPGDPIDGFLFETRLGFCEHFSASFVVLMRAAGIPARVVTGYQGGEFNNLSDYFMVRQRDAHAWAEVYLEDEGWVRIDPTAAVAPSRVSLGVTSVTGERAPAFIEASEAALRTFLSLRAAWDAASYQWSQWVLGYSAQRQLEFLAFLGFEDADIPEMTAGLTVTVMAIMIGLALMGRGPRSREDPVVRDYRRFCQRLGRIGLGRRADEGPRDYAERVGHARPDLALAVGRITELYVALRYAPAAPDRSALAHAVRRFRPRRSQGRASSAA